MILNKIFSIDLETGKNLAFSYGMNEPSGIAIHEKYGVVFVAFRGNPSIEVFNHKMGHLGTFLKYKNQTSTGLHVHKDTLYAANNEFNIMLKVPFKF